MGISALPGLSRTRHGVWKAQVTAFSGQAQEHNCTSWREGRYIVLFKVMENPRMRRHVVENGHWEKDDILVMNTCHAGLVPLVRCSFIWL